MPGDLTVRRRAPRCAPVLAAVAAMALSTSARAQEPSPSPSAAEPPPTLRETAPESGAGLMTGGTYALVGGTGLVIVGASYLAATGVSDWGGAIFGGVVLAGGGATFVWLGSRRAREQRAWSDDAGVTPPPGGGALLISGLTLAGGGAISLIAYGGLTLGYCEVDCFNPDTRVWFGLAGTAIGAGLGMVIAGAVVRHRHHRWRRSDAVVRTRITPTFAFSSTGAQFGVAGRF